VCSNYLAEEIVQEPDPEVAPQPVSHVADAVLPPSLQPARCRTEPGLTLSLREMVARVGSAVQRK
jgi:hypothetical protein